MSDLESGLKEAVQSASRSKPHLVPDDPLKAVRLRARGALIHAHHELRPRDGWSDADEIIFDMVTAWLESLGGRR